MGYSPVSSGKSRQELKLLVTSHPQSGAKRHIAESVTALLQQGKVWFLNAGVTALLQEVAWHSESKESHHKTNLTHEIYWEGKPQEVATSAWEEAAGN